MTKAAKMAQKVGACWCQGWSTLAAEGTHTSVTPPSLVLRACAEWCHVRRTIWAINHCYITGALPLYLEFQSSCNTYRKALPPPAWYMRSVPQRQHYTVPEQNFPACQVLNSRSNKHCIKVLNLKCTENAFVCTFDIAMAFTWRQPDKIGRSDVRYLILVVFYRGQ